MTITGNWELILSPPNCFLSGYFITAAKAQLEEISMNRMEYYSQQKRLATMSAKGMSAYFWVREWSLERFSLKSPIIQHSWKGKTTNNVKLSGSRRLGRKESWMRVHTWVLLGQLNYSISHSSCECMALCVFKKHLPPEPKEQKSMFVGLLKNSLRDWGILHMACRNVARPSREATNAEHKPMK